MKRRLAVVASVAAIAGAVTASPAAAGPNPTPNDGRCGAANMANENAAPYMAEAMNEHTDEHGDAGMFGAVANSSCESS
jgi:hypothetical protein